MDPEDYPSDSDASDEDFRPDQAEDDSASEVDSDDNVEGHDAEEDEEETSGGGRKRKQKTKKAGNKKVKIEKAKVEEEKESNGDENCLDDEDEERLTDALWADFLAGTGNSNGSSASESKSAAPTTKKEPPRKPTEAKKVIPEPAKLTTVTKIFEFAGEAVEVTEEVSKSNQPSQSEKPAGKLALGSSNGNAGPAKPFGGRPAGGGLGAVLGQIGKKNKLSTLEKTKLDWNSFKRSQGIEEELQTHNKGKNGYLERQDFLQRADVRQFEIEKSFRQTTRSNR